MMKKIVFNDAYCLTQAVLDSAKTMTRRLLKYGTLLGNWEETEKHLPYRDGEIVAIAQSYKELYPNADFEMVGNEFMTESAGWSNKLFGESQYMKHHIKITDVKIERLQDISDEDCLREGIRKCFDHYYHCYAYPYLTAGFLFDCPREAFSKLIDRVSGKGTWKRNPWVVAYSFERID